MSKILYVSEDLHRKLKLLATKMEISMQQATELAVEQWLDKAEQEQKMQEKLLDRIESKLSQEERAVLAAIMAKSNKNK